jgi:hypothetical protein
LIYLKTIDFIATGSLRATDFNHKKTKGNLLSFLFSINDKKGLQMGIITLMEFINLTRYVSYCGQMYELLKIALNDLVCKLELSFFLILVLVLFQMRIF